MRTITSGLSILALVAGMAVACSDSGTGRVGENPSERRPSASPPTAPADTPGRTQPGGGTTDTAPTPPPAVPQTDRPSTR
jgi:hypothetical protein